MLIARSAALLAGAVILAAAPALAKDPKPGAKTTQYGSVDAAGVYQLSLDEQAFDCRKLLGTMQIRIMQIRDYDPSKKTSDLSRTMQTTVDPALSIMLGKTSAYAADPDKRYRNDRAMLEAYNRQAAAKKCKVYDLDAELKPGKAFHDTPVPRSAPPAKPTAAQVPIQAPAQAKTAPAPK